jgi:hypothetical protein
MLNKQLKEVLQSEDVPATVLLVIAADLLGPDVLTWDPETISLEVEEATGDPIRPSSFNKLMAAIELVTSNGFYRDLPTFIRLCNTLYNGTLTLDFDPADAMEIAWGVTEALLIWPPDEEDEEPFDSKIIGYIGQVLREEGIMTPPDVLRLGITTSNEGDRIQSQFADDPPMFNAVRDKERAKGEAINAEVKQRLARALQLLDTLPFAEADAEGAIRKMFQSITQQESEGSQLRSV